MAHQEVSTYPSFPHGTTGSSCHSKNVTSWHPLSVPRGTPRAVHVAPSRVPRLRAGCPPHLLPHQELAPCHPLSVPRGTPRAVRVAPSVPRTTARTCFPSSAMRSSWHPKSGPRGTVPGATPASSKPAFSAILSDLPPSEPASRATRDGGTEIPFSPDS